MNSTQSIINGSGVRGRIIGLALASIFSLAPCTRADSGSADKPRIEETARGAVSATFTVDPPVVRLDRDTLLTIRVSSPTNLTVKLPPLETRLKGFAVAGSYDEPAMVREGKSVRNRKVRLTPRISDEYRIAPMAVTWRDPATGADQWFPTKPIVLPSEPLVRGEPGKTIGEPRGPVWIYPGLKGVLGYTAALLGLGALAYGAWRLLRKVRRAIQLRRMSPRERALFELAELIAKGLIARDRVKEFYFELTMIVRAYIERAHAIRAPEQTTEEFLAAVSNDPRFSPDVIQRLRNFMQAADLVKYAGFHPDLQSVDNATTTARTYIETDSAPQTLTPEPRTP